MNAMQVTVELPEDLAQLLAEKPSELNRTVLESLALEGVRSERLTVGQAKRLLGIESSYEMDGFLKAHGVFYSLTMEELERDVAAAAAFRVK